MAYLQDPWFTVEELDETIFAISEYGHWEKDVVRHGTRFILLEVLERD